MSLTVNVSVFKKMHFLFLVTKCGDYVLCTTEVTYVEIYLLAKKLRSSWPEADLSSPILCILFLFCVSQLDAIGLKETSFSFFVTRGRDRDKERRTRVRLTVFVQQEAMDITSAQPQVELSLQDLLCHISFERRPLVAVLSHTVFAFL